jgi:5-aminolevulinate synthase
MALWGASTDHGHPADQLVNSAGTERLRITPTPYHDDGLIRMLARALVDVWRRLQLPFEPSAALPE